MLPDTASSELDPLDRPDPDTAGAMRILDVSRKSVYRLGKAGKIKGYLLCGRRRWERASLRAYKEECRDAGPQFGPAPTGKRKPGRPRKPQRQRLSPPNRRPL
jgi:Helix-turn-helix domain